VRPSVPLELSSLGERLLMEYVFPAAGFAGADRIDG